MTTKIRMKMKKTRRKKTMIPMGPTSKQASKEALWGQKT